MTHKNNKPTLETDLHSGTEEWIHSQSDTIANNMVERMKWIMMITWADIKKAQLERMEQVSAIPTEEESVKRLMRNASYITGVELPWVNYFDN
jgi:hypothetical protein